MPEPGEPRDNENEPDINSLPDTKEIIPLTLEQTIEAAGNLKELSNALYSGNQSAAAESVDDLIQGLSQLKRGKAWIPAERNFEKFDFDNLHYSLKDILEHNNVLFKGGSFDLHNKALDKLLRKKIVKLLKEELKSIP